MRAMSSKILLQCNLKAWLNILVQESVTPFCVHARLAVGVWSWVLCLVFVPRNDTLVWKYSSSSKKPAVKFAWNDVQGIIFLHTSVMDLGCSIKWALSRNWANMQPNLVLWHKVPICISMTHAAQIVISSSSVNFWSEVLSKRVCNSNNKKSNKDDNDNTINSNNTFFCSLSDSCSVRYTKSIYV